ncbi:MAG: ADP-glyceromanno-heptose 6-epimerase [Ignavibacteriales bacterium]|nr:ADP-glyceromanno-heptose 6-epimerase [Ignavibacteriales bacterium]
MIVVTGGAGFIGSAIVWRLNQMGSDNIIIVDNLGESEKWKNLVGLKYADFYHKEEFIELIKEDRIPFQIKAVLHLGACSSTTERDADYLMYNNFKYTQNLAAYCLEKDSRFIYASSAATYGDGTNGYLDDEEKLDQLKPLNMYGYSKHFFDLWAKREEILDEIVGIKYFNVFGPNEYHKGDMRSVIHKAYGQIKESGKVKLFKSYNDMFDDGKQMRDFIYVKDAVDMTLHFLENNDGGLYNVGTGKARTWVDLVTSIFNAMDLEPNIEFIDMPENLRGKYQYFTEANIDKIKSVGYDKEITSLEDGVSDYVKEYLMKGKGLTS